MIDLINSISMPGTMKIGRYSEIHTPDVLVIDFSGNKTRGIDQHVEWAMAAAVALVKEPSPKPILRVRPSDL